MQTTEVEADIYGPDEGNVRKFFATHCKDEMDNSIHTDNIIISLGNLPPGARILIDYPCCPDCGVARNDTLMQLAGGRMEIVGHDSLCDCGFDWDNRVQEEYG